MCWGDFDLGVTSSQSVGKVGTFFFFFSKSLTLVFELTHCCLDYSLTGTHWCVETLLLRRSTWKRRTSVLKKFATTCPRRFPLLLRNSSQASCRRIPVTDSRWIRSSTTNSSKYVDLQEISCQCYETQLWHFYLEVKECENVSAWSVISTENRVGTLQPLHFFSLFFFNASPLPLSQGFTPDKLPPSSCTMVPELHPPSPAKKFFTKMAKSLFGKKKAKGEQAARAMGGLVFQISF